MNLNINKINNILNLYFEISNIVKSIIYKFLIVKSLYSYWICFEKNKRNNKNNRKNNKKRNNNNKYWKIKISKNNFNNFDNSNNSNNNNNN